MSKYIVGITGGIATGKTNVTDALQKAGAPVIDMDVISRELTRDGGEALKPILHTFGKKVFARTGFMKYSLDRKALGQLIFSDPAARKKLDDIMHPMIIRHAALQISQTDAPIIFLSAPLLYECGAQSMCNEVWCTFVPRREQLMRLMKRDGIPMTEAISRLQSQMPASRKADMANLVIDTSGTPEESAAKALQAYRQLQARLQTNQAFSLR